MLKNKASKAWIIIFFFFESSLVLTSFLVVQTFRGWCGVPYYEVQYDEEHGEQQRQFQGHFEEQVEIDKEFGKYEKIDVPAFEDVRKSTILHDFEKVSGETLVWWRVFTQGYR